ncbi:hypothetical protein FALCPG4_002434 [Fusarium falciforme]
MILVPNLVARAVDDQRRNPPKVAIILAILVSILILLTPIILGARGVRRFLSHQTMHDSPERNLCLTPEALNLMPVKKYRGTKTDVSRTGGNYSPGQPDSLQSCSICTEDFGRGVEFRPLPCGHRFHPACIDPWLLQRSLTCPLWCVHRTMLTIKYLSSIVASTLQLVSSPPPVPNHPLSHAESSSSLTCGRTDARD